MTTISKESLNQLFFDARTQNGFIDKPVPIELIKEIYDIAKMGATSMNTQPTRYVIVSSPKAKSRLMPTLMPGNVEKTKQAPVTVIVATDTQFYEHMPDIWHGPGAKEMFASNQPLAEATATRNGTLGGAYFMIAARACGLDCGPMSGVDLAKVNTEFFPNGRFMANFLINLGYGDTTKLFTRNKRLSFEQVCEVI
jgi:3-hydroxypropanoate dehydrogenase